MKTSLLYSLLYCFGITILREFIRKMLPDIADIAAAATFNVVNHVRDRFFRDLGLAPRRLADTVIMAQGTIARASRDLQPIKDLIIGETVTKAIFSELDYLVMRCNPGAASVRYSS